MMYNTRYLPENFDQCRLEKTILRHWFQYNLSVRFSWNALIQDGGKYHEKAYYLSPKHLNVTSSSSVPTFCNFSENRLFLDSN